MDEPIIPNTSGGMLVSTESAVATTHTSLNNPFGKSGRIGLSISLEVRIALSLALPSRRLKLPGILPTAYNFSSKSTLSGKKSIPGRGSGDMLTFVITTVSPHLMMHEPLDSPPYLPTSTVISLPPTIVLKIFASCI